MVHLEGESAKLLFKVLAEWNHALSYTSIVTDTHSANSNVPRTRQKSNSAQRVTPAENVVGIDLSTQRPHYVKSRTRKVTPSDQEDTKEAGHA